jgi:hypothetical protein
LLVVFGIVVEVAPLAQGCQVLVAIVAGDVVQVGDGEDDSDDAAFRCWVQRPL